MLQLISAAMIFFSSRFQEASVGICIVVLLAYYFPRHWITCVRGFWIRRFPPKLRLLTNEEYYEQTARETTRALEDLKNYCSSPEAKPWKVMMKLKDPQRYVLNNNNFGSNICLYFVLIFLDLLLLWKVHHI